MDHTDLLAKQIDYYRDRAPEYDEWFLREGRYERGPEVKQRWNAEVEVVRRALAVFAPRGDGLELACGTGWWTEQLAPHCDTLTAVDAVPEVIERNRQRVQSANVTYQQVDLFTWQPEQQYDVVFFSFWLSHVPVDRLAAFWSLVRSALRPSGRCFFIDSRHTPESRATNHVPTQADETLQTRKLNDGREYTIVKVYHTPEVLSQRLNVLGWEADLQVTQTFFCMAPLYFDRVKIDRVNLLYLKSL